MKWFKHDRLVGAFALAAMVVLFAESFLVVVARKQARHALTELDLRLHERDTLQRQTPAPRDESREMMAREIDAATERLNVERAKMLGVSVEAPLSGSLAASPVDAYFQITDFVESSRERAVSKGITIKPGERFGFSSHSRAGPDAEMRPVVLQQCAAMRHLLEVLMEVRPIALLSVQRERPAAVNQREQQDSKLAIEGRSISSIAKTEDPVDFFDVAPAISVGLPNRVQTTAFRIEFSGHTPVLRDVLNRLAFDSLPFFVRAIEVEPLSQTPVVAVVSSKASPDNSEIFVTQNASRFVVVVELITRVAETRKPQS